MHVCQMTHTQDEICVYFKLHLPHFLTLHWASSPPGHPGSWTDRELIVTLIMGHDLYFVSCRLSWVKFWSCELPYWPEWRTVPSFTAPATLSHPSAGHHLCWPEWWTVPSFTAPATLSPPSAGHHLCWPEWRTVPSLTAPATLSPHSAGHHLCYSQCCAGKLHGIKVVIVSILTACDS